MVLLLVHLSHLHFFLMDGKVVWVKANSNSVSLIGVHLGPIIRGKLSLILRHAIGVLRHLLMLAGHVELHVWLSGI